MDRPEPKSMDRLIPHDLPSLILASILCAYWIRVLRMVRRAHDRARRAGFSRHGSHFIPPEPVGKIVRIVWIPLVAVWIWHPYYTAFTAEPSTSLTAPLFHNTTLSWLAAFVAALAFAGTHFCWKRM